MGSKLFNRVARAAAAVTLAMAVAGCGGEETRLTYAPSSSETEVADLNPNALADYLSRSQLDTPALIRDIGDALRAGKGFRQRIKDRMDVATLATVFVDREMTLHVVTFRTETCPECKGTGTRPMPFDAVTSKVSIDLRCLKCDGKGKIEGFTTERKYMLNASDFRDPASARERIDARSFQDVPPEARKWINALASDDPRERLAACVWLDRYYVKTGERFQTLLPMLEKHRYFEKSDEKHMMAWQFWAGRGIPGEEARAYYRVIADARNGKVVRKGFFPENR